MAVATPLRDDEEVLGGMIRIIYKYPDSIRRDCFNYVFVRNHKTIIRSKWVLRIAMLHFDITRRFWMA